MPVDGGPGSRPGAAAQCHRVDAAAASHVRPDVSAVVSCSGIATSQRRGCRTPEGWTNQFSGIRKRRSSWTLIRSGVAARPCRQDIEIEMDRFEGTRSASAKKYTFMDRPEGSAQEKADIAVDALATLMGAEHRTGFCCSHVAGWAFGDQ